MKSVLFAAAALTLASGAWAGDGPARTAAADEQVVKDPDWLAAPSSQDRAKAYPKAALEAGVGGETALRCRVKPDGWLTGCLLVKETPAGKGFGGAALGLADRFRMKPEAIPPAAPGKSDPEVLVPVRWAIIEQPDWARMPSPDELSYLYPDKAVQAGQAGMAMVRCQVKTDGTLENCVTIEKSPEGWGFGEATVRAAVHYFRMKPGTLDGKPIDGAIVTVPMNWRMEGVGANLRIGEGSLLIVALKPDAKPADDFDQVLNCPTASDKARKCLALGAPWAERPMRAKAWEVINRRHLVVGVTWLSCHVADDGALRDCAVNGEATPDKEAAMRELAAGLKAAPEARHGIPTRGELVLVKFDWAQLRDATKPLPGASH